MIMDIKDNIIMLLKEDLECVHMYLDDLKIPRTDTEGEVFSIVGRIKQLEKRFYLELDKVETFYLNRNPPL